MYTVLNTIHHHLAWTLVYIGTLLFGMGLYIAVYLRRDVTVMFRRTVYVMGGLAMVQAGLGAVQWFVYNMRPEGEAHWIYGLGTAIALPFFAYIEMTAEKRPSMGSYVWGFGMLVAIGFRSILTGM